MPPYNLTLTQEEANTLQFALIEYVHRNARILDQAQPGFLEEAQAMIRTEITEANALRAKLPRYYRPTRKG